MDPDAARRARQKALKADLAEVYEDEEACPPEWLDVLMRIDDATEALERDIAGEVQRFASEPDVRVALERRERFAARLRTRVDELNTRIRRLNLIAPLPRFQRVGLRADDLLKPLYRTRRAVEPRT